MAKKVSKYKKVLVKTDSRSIQVYAGKTTREALKHVFRDEVPLFDAVKIKQVIDAAYDAGRRDGTAEAVVKMLGAIDEVERSLAYRKPGRPSKRKK